MPRHHRKWSRPRLPRPAQDDLRAPRQSSQRPDFSSDGTDVLPRLSCAGEGLVGAPRRVRTMALCAA